MVIINVAIAVSMATSLEGTVIIWNNPANSGGIVCTNVVNISENTTISLVMNVRRSIAAPCIRYIVDSKVLNTCSIVLLSLIKSFK